MELFPEFKFEPKSAAGNTEFASKPAQDKPVAMTPSTAERLVELATKFRNLDAWERIRENELIGIKHPETGEIGLISILGRGCQIYALHFHLPPEGIEFWQRAMRNIAPDKDSIRMLECEFKNKDEAEPYDVAVVARHGKISRKRRGVPGFRSYVRGAMEKRISQLEGEQLCLVFDLFFLYFSKAFPGKHKSFYEWGKTCEDDHKIPVLFLKDGGSPLYLEDWCIEKMVIPSIASENTPA